MPPKKSLLQKLRWPLRIVAVGAASLGLLILLMFNPSWMYAHATNLRTWTVLHNNPIDPLLEQRIADAQELLQASEIYDPTWKLELCLDDGSHFPSLPRRVLGDAFAWGYANKVVLGAPIDAATNHAEIRGIGFNLTQLLAHEAIHCMQYHDLGLWHSRPLADIPQWKWEGYAEYISHKDASEPDLLTQIRSVQMALNTSHNGWMDLTADTGVPMHYAQFQLMVRYCLDMEGKTWHELVDDERSPEAIVTAMTAWVDSQS